jgi:hypothetical protein
MGHATPRTRWIAALAPGLLAGACGLIASCNIVTPAAYLALGQGNVSAAYAPVDRPTVVFVDDRRNVIPMNATRIRRAIADKVGTDLMENEVLTKVIAAQDAMSVVRNRDREGQLMSIDTIGAAVGAEQIIYIEMLSFKGSPDGYSPRPTAACQLKMVDVPNRTRLFPPETAEAPWFPVEVVSGPISPELYQSTTGRRQIESLLAAQLGDQVAKVFYKHEAEPLGTRLDRQ